MTLPALVLTTLLAVTATAQEQVYDVGNGVTTPVVLRRVNPNLTGRVMKEKFKASSRFVRPFGRMVASATWWSKAADPDLNASAIETLKQWERYEIYVESFPTPGRRVQVSTEGGTQPRWRRDQSELTFCRRKVA